MKLFFRICLLVLLSLYTINVAAQVVSKVPEWVNPIDIKSIGPVNKNKVQNGFYYVLLDEQFNEVLKQRYFHCAKSALTEEALVHVSQIEFSYDPTYEKASLHSVRIHRGSEIIDKTKDIDVKILNEERQRGSGVLRGRKTFYTNLSDVRKGDIVEFCYSYSGKNPIMADYFNRNFSLSYSEPVGKIYARIVFPKSVTPNIIYKNTEIKPVIKQEAVNDYVWEVNNPTVLTLESSTPQWYDPYAEVQISNLGSWQEAKKHYQTFFNLKKYDNSGLKIIVDSIVNSTKYKDAQISGIVDFVQKQVRYSGDESGIHSHIPRTPDLVLKNRYGDCKEKSVLLNEMLKLMEVEAYPVLVNTTIGKRLMDHVPSINIFDHCISVFVYKNRLQFIDPTISYQRGHFESRLVPAYETGMIMDGKEETFTTIPVDERTSKSDVREDFTIEASGDTRLRATTVYTGSLADEIRYTFLTNSLDDIQENFKQFYTRYTTDIEVIDTVTYSDNPRRNEFTVVESYLLKNFWAAPDSGKSRAIVREFAPYALLTKLNFGDEGKRKDPLSILYPLNHKQTISVFKKEGWNIAESVKEEDNPFFSYSYTSRVQGAMTLELIYDFKTKTGVVEPKDYANYKSKMDFVNVNIVFSAQETPLSDGTMGFNWALTLTTICSLIFSCIFVRYLYNRPFEAEDETRYTVIGGWLILLAIGITISPLRTFVQLLLFYIDESGIDYSVFYFDELSPYFSPMKGYLALFINFVNTFLFVMSILVVILFYQRKAAFKTLFTYYSIGSVAFMIFDVILLNYYNGDSTNFEDRSELSKETTAMIRVIIYTVIWIPYIWYSERSTYTFTRGSNITVPEIFTDTPEAPPSPLPLAEEEQIPTDTKL
ncbi:MAG: DUF3857 domain-containing protein [Bacteroidia bacterium]